MLRDRETGLTLTLCPVQRQRHVNKAIDVERQRDWTDTDPVSSAETEAGKQSN